MVEVHLPEMIAKELLHEHPRNSNKHNRHMFKELRQSIRENGFDESLIVVQRPEEDGYWIVSGNHRFRAGVAEGMEEFPCVVRHDWDEVEEQIELVRRNFVRGNIDRDAFTVAVNTLAEDHALSLDDVRDRMGFEDADVFLKFYQQEEEKRERDQVAATTSAPQVKMIDDLGLILSSIFEQYGDTVPHSFIIFPAGGKKHMFVAATPALKRSLEQIAEKCRAEHLDINVALGGLLVVGMHTTNFQTGQTADVDAVRDAGEEEGDADL